MYRLLLRLLPRHRRAAYGDEMAEVFLSATIDARLQGGQPAVFRTWIRELMSLFRFAWRDRVSGSLGGGHAPLGRDIQWAVRGVRARGWTGALSVVLMAMAMAASTLVFATADALIFNTTPFPESDRLVSVRGAGSRASLEALRGQTDVFSHVSAHQPGGAFFDGATEPVSVDIEFVTPGLFETLGVMPRWGRPLLESDRASTSPTFAVIDATLARERFGSPARALGQILETSERPLTIVGVMPEGFRYPTGRVRIWRALDHERLNPSFGVMQILARLQPGLTMADAGATLATRLPNLIRKASGTVEVVPRVFGATVQERATMLKVLLGAALCLLLAACTNVISLELAGAVRRSRTLSIRMALGGSRASLIRTGFLEGGILMAGAFVIAIALVVAGAAAVTAVLPESVTLSGVNPVDMDGRALAALAATVVVAWLATSLPIAVGASRPNLLQVLKADDRSATMSRRGVWLRRAIATGQVALAMLLLAGGMLYVQSYAALLDVDTGIRTDGVYTLSVTTPTRHFSREAHTELMSRLVTQLAGHPQVVAVAPVAGSVPPAAGYTTQAVVETDTSGGSGVTVVLSLFDVDPAFFDVIGSTPLRGRVLDTHDGPDAIVITDTLARRLWGSVDVVGRSFSLKDMRLHFTVAGVVPHIRTNRDELGGPSATTFSLFRRPPSPHLIPAPVSDQSGPALVNAPTGARPMLIASILVRTSPGVNPEHLLQLARTVDARGVYRMRTLDALYAARHAEARMATVIITTFAVVAFLVATAGVFGLMAFMVSSRTREIGIRMALGADRHQVGRLVMGSAARLVAAGITLGIVATIVASRWIESQLFNISGSDPLTLATVAILIAAAATLSTWNPARRASRVDPAITLRAE